MPFDALNQHFVWLPHGGRLFTAGLDQVRDWSAADLEGTGLDLFDIDTIDVPRESVKPS